MRIIILTSARRGIASRVLEKLCAEPALTIAGVVLAHGASANKKKTRQRRFQKILRIGLLGTLNGIRLRAWYLDNEATDIIALCTSMNIPLAETAALNSDDTRKLFREASADIGLSLGNGYIAKSVFSIPRYGMLNIHMEILPAYQGAQSVIWPIFEGARETGFTIHQIDSHIDTGPILFQQKYPIVFGSTLRETVEKTLSTTREKIPEAFLYICRNYEVLMNEAKVQEKGKSYTTPTFYQFLRMVRMNKVLYVESLTKRAT